MYAADAGQGLTLYTGIILRKSRSVVINLADYRGKKKQMIADKDKDYIYLRLSLSVNQ